MGREKRNFRKDHLYHVIRRGHNQDFIYRDSEDKLSFFEIYKDIQKSESISFLYYVLLDNHYHFLVQAGDSDVSHVFQRLNQGYSRYYNKKYNQNGTAYGSKLKAYHVADFKYLVTLLTYIAGNPVRAGIVNYPEQYKWSAHSEIIKNKNSLIDREKLFMLLGFKGDKSITEYANLMNEQFALNEHRTKRIL